MAKNPKSTGRAMLTASMPTGLDDPRLMDVADIVKAVDQMEVVSDSVSPTASTEPKTLDDIRDLAWAKHNAPTGQKAQSAAPPRPTKHPKTLDEISASAWHRFNNPRHGRTPGDR